MAMRLSEVHPSLVHFPIAFLPAAIGADAAGLLTKHRELFVVGKVGIAAAAVGAALAGVFGFIAQEEVNVEGEALDVLRTHRALNVAALGVVTTLAVVRARAARPSVGYLAAGLGAVAGVLYSAYLGGKLVYDHGAGVARAGGLAGESPELTGRGASHAAMTAAKHLGKGIANTARDIAKGELVPALR